MGQWIKKGDKVVVLAGSDKGRTGSVLRKKGERVVVQGINVRKKHVKRQAEAKRPSIIEIEAPLPLSRVSLCDENDKPIKVRVRQTQEGKELYYLRDGKEVALRTLRKSV